jgi:transcriptional regulator with XRE-family HTH domain
MATRINKKLVTAFSRALKSIRLEKELTQEQVAYAAKVHRTYIAFLEGRRKQPSIDAVFKIANGLDIKPSELVKRVESYYFKK